MLNGIRNAADTTAVKLLLALIIASFAVWGVGDIFRGTTQTDIAKVGERGISKEVFERAVAREMEQYRQLFNGEIPEIIRISVEDNVESQLINRALLEAEAQAIGLRIPDSVAAAHIRRQPAFQDDGGFSKTQFNAMLNYNRISEPQYVAQVKRDLAIEMLADIIMEGNVPMRDQAEIMLRARGEQRTVSMLTLPQDMIKDIADPDEQTLQQYYETQGDRFSAPEYRRASLLTLSRTDLIKDVDLSEARVQQYYKDHSSAFIIPASYTLKQITLPDMQTALALRGALEAGKTLEDYRNTQPESDLPDAWTDLGEISADELTDEAQAALTVLDEKDPPLYSQPFETPFGVQLYYVTAYTPAKKQPMEEVAGQITEQLVNEQMDDLIYNASLRIQDAIAGGSTMEEAAATGGGKVTAIGPIDRQGMKPDGGNDDALPLIPELMDTIFSQSPDDAPRLERSSTNQYFAVVVEEITPSRTRALDEVRGTVTTAWKAEEKARQLAELAEDIAERIRQGAALADIAGEHALAAPAEQTLKRHENMHGAPASTIPEALKQAVFSAQEGGITAPFRRPDGAWVIARVTQITPAKNVTEQAIADMETQLQQQWQNDVLDRYLAYLGKKYTVERYRTGTPVEEVMDLL